MTESLRRCTKCLVEKPPSEFKKDRRRKSGLSGACKVCSRLAATAWKRANVEHVRQYTAARDAGRPKWRPSPEAQRRGAKAYAKRHPGKVRANWATKRARKSAAPGKYTAEDVARILKLQRGRCAYCRCRVGDEYHVDHIKSLARGGTNWPRNLQILCQPCNSRKHASDPIEFARKSGFLL